MYLWCKLCRLVWCLLAPLQRGVALLARCGPGQHRLKTVLACDRQPGHVCLRGHQTPRSIGAAPCHDHQCPICGLSPPGSSTPPKRMEPPKGHPTACPKQRIHRRSLEEMPHDEFRARERHRQSRGGRSHTLSEPMSDLWWEPNSLAPGSFQVPFCGGLSFGRGPRRASP